MNDLLSNIVKNGYCVGCGLCASGHNSQYHMDFTDKGKYEPNKVGEKQLNVEAKDLCPFSNECMNEDKIGKMLFSSHQDIKHDQYLGHYLKNFAGYVKKGDERDKGSSGGMGSWLLKKMLQAGMVSHVIHVKKNLDQKSGILFRYAVSDSIDSIQEGAKSKYYPVEISEVMEQVRRVPGNYAFVGLPCFVKAVRLLAQQDPIIAHRIRYTVGLVCGHLKSDRFAKYMGWQMGIEPEQLVDFDFRVKLEGKSASQYGVEAKGWKDGVLSVKHSPVNQLFGTNWGYGFFKLKACDYCDDVLVETADITIGDAWLSEYEKDWKGTNIIIVRNPDVLALLSQFPDELHLDELSAEKIVLSQAGGFRHRREGLAYRLFLKDQMEEWRPRKRVEASVHLSKERKSIYKARMNMIEECDNAYEKAIQGKSFDIFVKHMQPILAGYDKLLKKPLWVRVLAKGKRTIKSILHP